MYSRPYSRSVITKPQQPQGRVTFCSACDKQKPDCLWVTHPSYSEDLCLCKDCRSQKWAQGRLVHVDAAFKDVPL